MAATMRIADATDLPDLPGLSDPSIDAERQRALEARAWHRHRWVVARLDRDTMPGLVRMWLEAEAVRRFGVIGSAQQ